MHRSLAPEIAKHVVIFGDVALSDLKWLYRHCSLFVYPSFIEGFGIPPLEAIACGASTICSNTTAMAEFSFLGDRLVNPASQHELNEKISYYLDKPGFPELESAQKFIRSEYSWDVAADRLLSLFH